ncbi:MAG: hypothetical protein ACXWL9_04720 [Syntrophales bacterium]
MSFNVDIPAPPQPPAAATLVFPSGTITTTTPAYTWNAVSNATDYYLWVNDSSGNRIQQWYTAVATGCGAGTGSCSITPATTLNAGAGRWRGKASNSAGASPWSTPLSVTVQRATSGPRGAAILISPSGTTTATPTYTWNAFSNSTWYYLWVNDSTGNRIQQWYTAAAVGCPAGTGTCSVTPAIILNPGAAQWWIQTWNSSGTGPWSSSMPFTVPG